MLFSFGLLNLGHLSLIVFNFCQERSRSHQSRVTLDHLSPNPISQRRASFFFAALHAEFLYLILFLYISQADGAQNPFEI
jgi:hypothetical protein